MSGVVDEHGQQWEHCTACRVFIEIEKLGYELPSPEHKYGRDLCPECMKASKLPKVEANKIPTVTFTCLDGQVAVQRTIDTEPVVVATKTIHTLDKPIVFQVIDH